MNTTVNADGLLPCPFCGTSDSLRVVGVESSVVCGNCSAVMPRAVAEYAMQPESARQMWDTREGVEHV
jgi:hypothetical protein